MVKRFYPNKTALRELLRFKSLPKEVQNVMADKMHATVRFLKFTHDERQTKITVCDQKVMKYRGGQAFVQTTMLGTICYFRDEKNVYTRDPREVVHFLQQNFYIAKAIQVEAFITSVQSDQWGGRKTGTNIAKYHSALETRVLTHKNILKAIFRGNCTNRDNAVRRYFKATYGLNISLKVYCEMQARTNDHSLALVLTTTTNLQNAHRFLMNKAQSLTSKQRVILNDLMQMSETMRKKVNFAWTPRRMEEEHDKLVRVMVKLQAEGTPFVGVEYEVEPPTIPGITFFMDNRELLMESKLMNHCIGTSSIYIDRLVKFESLLIAYDRSNARGTAELRINYNKDEPLTLTKRQFSARGNQSMSKEAQEDLRYVMELIENSKFAEYLASLKGTKQEV